MMNFWVKFRQKRGEIIGVILRPSFGDPSSILRASFDHHKLILYPSYNDPISNLYPSYIPALKTGLFHGFSYHF